MATIDEILGNRNLINLLAGFGSNLDPTGVGGALGAPVIQYNRALGAQERAAAQEQRQSTQNDMMLDVLRSWGPITPKGEPGPTSISATDTGIRTEIDGPLAASQQAQAQATSPPTLQAPVGTVRRDPQGNIIPAAPGQLPLQPYNAPSTPTPPTGAPPGPPVRRDSQGNIIPAAPPQMNFPPYQGPRSDVDEMRQRLAALRPFLSALLG